MRGNGEIVKIKIENLHKSFGRNEVLRGVDLEIFSGESMVIIGGSGAGKSVLMKCIIGILKPDSGSIYVDGVDITRLDEDKLGEVRKKFGMLFQGGALFDSLSVWENVGFGLRQTRDLSDIEIRRISSEKLRLVGLYGVEDLMPGELSGGMKKRVALARAIAMEPEIIIYDEPTTGLDPVMTHIITDLILDLKYKLRITSISITHDIHAAYKIADRIAMLYKGRIIQTGTPDEIKLTTNPIVRQFVYGMTKGPITDEMEIYRRET